jgi:hypothetical protein
MRLFDSVGSQHLQHQQQLNQNQNKLQSTVAPSSSILSLQQHQQQQQRFNMTSMKQTRKYYQGEDTKNPLDYKSSRFNMEQSWNPVNNYIYGTSMQSVYNQPEREVSTHRKLERILNINANVREKERVKDVEYTDRDAWGKVKNRPEKSSSRRLLGEFINNEAPRLCDHAIDFYDSESSKKRYCTPLESYISTGRDMVCVVVI